MKVYVVEAGDPESSEIVAIYAEELRAKAHAAALRAKINAMRDEEPGRGGRDYTAEDWEKHAEKWREVISWWWAKSEAHDVIE